MAGPRAGNDAGAGDATAPASIGYSSDPPDRITLRRGRSGAHGGTVAGMPIPRRYTTDAIVLSRFDLGEADRVLTLITPTGGKLKAIAKGIRKPTSRLGGSLEPFAELTVGLARGRTFDVVTEVRVGHAWLHLRDSLESAATAWYLAELADRSLEERHAAEPQYLLLRRAYELLDAAMAPGRVARWYEMHLLDELGQRPEVDRCVECDRVLDADERFRWVPPLGGDPVRALSGARARPDRDQPRGGQAAQGLPAPRHRGDRDAAARARGRTRDRGGPAGVRPRRARTRRPLAGVPRRGPAGPPGGRRPAVTVLRRSVAAAGIAGGGVRRHAGGQGRRPGRGRPDGGPSVRHRRRAAVSRVRPGARPARRPVGRRPPRRLAAVGPRPAATRDARPGGRAAAGRRQRRAPGPRRDDAVAAPPQPRAQRRQQRRRRPAGPRARLAARDVAPAPAARPPPGEPCGPPGGTLRGPFPGHPVRGRPGRLRGRPARATRDHRRPPGHRGRPCPGRRPGQRGGRGRRRLPDDVAQPLLRQRVRRLGARRREDRADRRGPRDDPADGGARDARRRGPRVGRDDRRRAGHGRAPGRRVAHRAVRDRRQPPQPDRRAGACDRRDRRRDRDRVLADGLRRGRRRPRSPGRSATPSMSPESSTSRSARTSTGRSRCRSTRPGWSS